ncbi:MAG: mechanosensitive ion channel [Myxococcales bacterium]|nr:mechanosensitive ion channel [Myxococcales bacterium]
MDWLRQQALDLWERVKDHLPTIGAAVGVLILGWIVALLLRRMMFALLKRTTLDDKLAQAMGIETGGERGARIERIIASGVYYLALVAVFIVFFTILGVDQITQPLVTVLNGLAGSVPNIFKALAIGLVGVLVAYMVRTVLRRALKAFRFDERVARLEDKPLDKTPAPPAAAPAEDATRAAAAEPTEARREVDRDKKAKKKKARTDDAAAKPKVQAGGFSDIISNLAFWAILIVTAVGVLEALDITMLAGPLKTAVEKVTEYLPRVLGAALILAIGYVIARAARSVVATLLRQIGLDRAIERLGLGKAFRTQPLSRVLGTLALAFVLLHAVISAVDKLDVPAISEPARQILDQFYAYLPKLFVGGLLLVVGVAVARVVGNLVARIAAALGLDALARHLGTKKPATDAAAAATAEVATDTEPEPEAEPEAEQPEEVRRLLEAGKAIKKPSDLLGVLVGAVIILLFARQVLSTVGLPDLAKLFDVLLAYLPQVAIAAVLVGAGLWAGRWASERIREMTQKSQDRAARALAPVARVGIIAFACMMALQQLGVGERLITVGFALVLGAVCVAAALAFGLGGRDVAARILNKEYERRQK